MPTWSTDIVPKSERFAYWREVRAKNLFGVTAELERDAHASFQGSFAALPVGPASVVEVHASPYRVTRHAADIERAPGDSLCIYQQIDGGGWFETRNGEFVVPRGGLAASYSDLPYLTRPTTRGGYHFRIVKIPFSVCKPLFDCRQMTPGLVREDTGLAPMLAACFATFVQQAPRLHGEAAQVAIEALAWLALGARGQGGRTDERALAAQREGRLQLANRLIDRHLRSPNLSVAKVAGLMSISERQLHSLFEPTGVSFSRTVTLRRVALARQRLEQGADASVAATAFTCGFDSLATFYRAFKAVYGMVPRDFLRRSRS